MNRDIPSICLRTNEGKIDKQVYNKFIRKLYSFENTIDYYCQYNVVFDIKISIDTKTCSFSLS